MALDKAIKYGKEKRKPYMKYCEQIDPSCRCNGGCEWCRDNRLYNWNREKERTEMELKEYENESKKSSKDN